MVVSWWEFRWIWQIRQNFVAQFIQLLKCWLQELGIKLSYDPTIPLLGIYPEKTIFENDICTPVFIAALFPVARTWKQPKCPLTRWMDKEVVVHIYDGILLSHKKEHIWISANEVSEPRAYYTEWSKSEREKQIWYISAYIWNLERWYWWTCLRGSKGDADLWTPGAVGKKERVGQMERVTWKHRH